MSNYRETSGWNNENELRCLIILKKLMKANFRPRGMHTDLCREMARQTDLKFNTINAKVGNFKSVAGINNKSNASTNTVSIYNRYGNYSVNELCLLLKYSKNSI